MFLKYLSFKQYVLYSPRLLLVESTYTLHLISQKCTEVGYQYCFLYKLLHGKIDCQELLSSLNILVPRLTSRQNNNFYCNKAQTNILLKTPINSMCNNYIGFHIFLEI